MSKEKEEQGNDLLNFDWDTGNDDFFGIQATSASPTPTKKEEVETVDETEEEKAAKLAAEETKKKEEEEDDDFFENIDTSKNNDGKEKSKKEDDPELVSYTDLVKDFKETGIFKHVQIEDDEEVDEDRYFELAEQEYETEVSERLKNWAVNDLDEDAQAFIKFKRDGGKTSEFFKAYSKQTELPSGNIEDEDYQDAVIRYQLSEEGWDREEIEDRLSYLTESNKKEKIAKKYDEKIKELDSKNKEALLKQAEADKVKAKKTEDDFRSSVKEALDETQEIKGIKISPQDRLKIFNFLTKKEHKVSTDKSITGFQKKLAETFQDTDKMILLAKLMESDFDLSGFEKQIVTNKTKQVKSNLEQRKNLRPNNSGSSLSGSSLADLF